MAERRIPRNIAERTKFSPTPEVAGLHGILKIIGLVISDISTKCTQAVQSRCDTLNNRSWLREKGRSVAPQATGSFGSWVPKLLFYVPGFTSSGPAPGMDAIFRVHSDKNERTQPPKIHARLAVMTRVKQMHLKRKNISSVWFRQKYERFVCF